MGNKALKAAMAKKTVTKSTATKSKSIKMTVVKPSENLFKVLGFPDGEAEVMLMRSDLMIDLRLWIEKSGLTQAAIAQKLGITQSRVSDLVRGRWEKFNLEMLITLEGRLGRKVSLKLVA
jgi:predicted XRE-type DNA-binding protein